MINADWTGHLQAYLASVALRENRLPHTENLTLGKPKQFKQYSHEVVSLLFHLGFTEIILTVTTS